MGALGRLSASIAHEINNPLQAMQGYQEMVEAELATPHPSDRLLQYVKIIHTEKERIAHIIRKMEDFYRPSLEEKSLTDLRKTMESMLALCSPKLKKDRINVVETWNPAVIPIWANTDQIKQLFLNLLLDSIDAMPDGGEIHISAELDHPLPLVPETPSVRLEFQDNGTGMPEETLAHLFEPFFTTKPHNSGLGLSICYTIVTQHQGEIKASSQVGKGTTFTIWLPVGSSPHLKPS
jgi:two-component system NtrC family sensor kinase